MLSGFCLGLLFGVARVSLAESIVDEGSPLEVIATGFGLADGPAWNGSSALYFPDVKGQKPILFGTIFAHDAESVLIRVIMAEYRVPLLRRQIRWRLSDV